MTEDFEDDPREAGGKGPDAFRTISEVADDLGLPQHVLRFWETRFPQIKPIKRGGGRRYYRPGDVELLRGVKQLLYGEGYTIRGVQRILREQGGRKLAQAAGAAGLSPAASTERSEPDFYAPRRDAPPPDSSYADVENDDVVIAAPRHEAEGPAPAARPAEPPRAASARAGLSEGQIGRLSAALDDLNACRRLLDGMS